MTRKEAKEKLYLEWQKFLEDNIDYAGISEAYKMAFKALEQELKTGKWVSQDEDDLKISNYRCSNCGYYQDDVTNYCPNCGAKMEGDRND